MFQSQRTPANALILSLMFMTSACQSADPEVAPPAGDPPGKNASGPAIEISEKSFKCIRDMKQVRGFFVDNLTGDIDGTLAVANSSTGGVYPPGSVVQLVPNCRAWSLPMDRFRPRADCRVRNCCSSKSVVLRCKKS